jgi:hypothetical protein
MSFYFLAPGNLPMFAYVIFARSSQLRDSAAGIAIYDIEELMCLIERVQRAHGSG